MVYPFFVFTPKSTLTGVVVPDRVQSIGQIELLNHLTECKQMTDVKLIFYVSLLETI